MEGLTPEKKMDASASSSSDSESSSSDSDDSDPDFEEASKEEDPF